MDYLDWLEANWQNGRPYLRCEAAVNSARESLDKELAEIALDNRPTEGAERHTPLVYKVRGLEPYREALREAELSGGDPAEILERNNRERSNWIVEENSRWWMQARKESLKRLYEEPYEQTLRERDNCTFDRYPKSWLGLNKDQWGEQLADRIWALGWLDDLKRGISHFDAVFAWFVEAEEWRSLILSQGAEFVAQLSAPKRCADATRRAYKTVTRCKFRYGGGTSLLQRTMLTFIDLNFALLYRSSSFEHRLNVFKKKAQE